MLLSVKFIALVPEDGSCIHALATAEADEMVFEKILFLTSTPVIPVPVITRHVVLSAAVFAPNKTPERLTVL